MTSTILSSWNNTKTKQTILDFIMAVTNENGPDYVFPAERIATFDNDGTLWCEHPLPPQFMGAIHTITSAVKEKPELKDKPLYKAVVEKDMSFFVPYLNNERLPELIDMFLEIAAGETQPAYETRITSWLETAQHPRFGRPYTKMVFQPMIELMDYLRANDFKVFIVSGGGMDFVRLFSEKIYKIPREYVVGGNLKLTLESINGKPVLVRQAGIIEPYCDGPGKPINIELHIGRPPILACGNSNGDVPMMEYTAASGKPYLNLLVHHDDNKREYASEHSAEKALKIVKNRKWTIISIKNDFKTVFPLE